MGDFNEIFSYEESSNDTSVVVDVCLTFKNAAVIVILLI